MGQLQIRIGRHYSSEVGMKSRALSLLMPLTPSFLISQLCRWWPSRLYYLLYLLYILRFDETNLADLTPRLAIDVHFLASFHIPSLNVSAI